MKLSTLFYYICYKNTLIIQITIGVHTGGIFLGAYNTIILNLYKYIFNYNNMFDSVQDHEHF